MSRKRKASHQKDISSDSESDFTEENTTTEMKIKKEPNNSTEKLSQYEMLQLKRREERNKLLESFGINDLVREIKVKSERTQPKQKQTKNDSERFRIRNREQLPKREPSRRIRQLEAKKLEEEKEEEENESVEEVDDRVLDSTPMFVEEESLNVAELLEDFKLNINAFAEYKPNVDLRTCDLDIFRNNISCLQLTREPMKVVRARIQSLCVHPAIHKKLVIVGSTTGSVGLCDLESDQDKVMEFTPHRRPVNCITIKKDDHSKFYTTSHDGTLLCGDVQAAVFNNVYATEHNTKDNHLTWHDEVDSNTLLVAHGNGHVGLLDLRTRKRISVWYKCFVRSVRTVQKHPFEQQFLASSSSSLCSIFDIRTTKLPALCEIKHAKALTSAFYSPDATYILTTCNDDKLRLYDTSTKSGVPKVKHTYLHNNHTGRWLSVFKANWYPSRNDAFLVGSLLMPRRIQVYGNDGNILAQLIDEENMTTICPVIDCHSSLPLIVGGNSSGRVFAFTQPIEF